MKMRICLLLAVWLLNGCENPEGQTDRFLANGTKGVEEKARGNVQPLPTLKPRDVAPLVIERDPFKR